jgi:hypothetical protein
LRAFVGLFATRLRYSTLAKTACKGDSKNPHSLQGVSQITHPFDHLQVRTWIWQVP